MTHMVVEEDYSSGYYLVVYACISILVGMTIVLLLYVVCSKRYKLNWFEKTILQAANEQRLGFEDVATDVSLATPKSVSSQGSGARFFDTSVPAPPPTTDFWVPPSLHRQASLTQSDCPDFSGDDSLPQTPNTPLGISPFSSRQSTPIQPSPTATSVRPKRSSMHAKLDYTKIDAAMYQKTQETGTDDAPVNDIRGSVQVTLFYDSCSFVLHVWLIQAKDLVPRESVSDSADPYAKLRLLPDKKTFRKSKICKKTLNPNFEEEFTFAVVPTELTRRILEILLYHFDQSARHLCMGSVQISLEHIDFAEKVTVWKNVLPCDEKDDKAELGDLMFSLGYLPSAERLTVVILKARNLTAVDEDKNTSDTFVKVSVIQNGRRIKKKKTATQRGTLDPVFNEAITFSISKENLKNAVTLEFAVIHDNILGQNDQVLGRVIIGPQSKDEEWRHFKDMQASKTAVARWHSLTDLLPI